MLLGILITVCNVWATIAFCSIDSFRLCTISDATDSSTRKTKRTKLKCFVPGCNQTFDNDYRLSHKKKHHKGLLFKNKSVPYETLGALKNPFLIAAKQRQTSQVRGDFISTSDIKETYLDLNRKMKG